MNNDELNRWAAEFLGRQKSNYNGYEYWVNSNGDIEFSADGKDYHIPKWNPCQDRNQAQLVVDKVFKLIDDNKDWELYHRFENACTGWTTYSIMALKLTSEQLVRAAYEAVEGGDDDTRET